MTATNTRVPASAPPGAGVAKAMLELANVLWGDATYEAGGTAWMRDAGCRDHDPEMFFPVGRPGHRLYEEHKAAAAAVCRTCPVRRSCENWSARSGQRFGIWGAHDVEDRRAANAAARRAGGQAGEEAA